MSISNRSIGRNPVQLLCLTLVCMVIQAAEPTRGTLVRGEEIRLLPVSAPGLPSGVLSAVLFGDTAKVGIYVLRNRFPPNATLAPHTHGSKWRIYTILEGEVRFGFGSKIDAASAVRLGPGSVATTGPNDMPHYFIAGPQGAVLNVVAEGPFVTNYASQ